jgi:hypothetical protein
MRYVIGGLIGALLGFTGQFLVDSSRQLDITHLSWSPAAYISVQSDIPRLFPDGPAYYWAYSPNGRTLGTPYMSKNGPVIPSGIRPVVSAAPAQKADWQRLWCQLLFLNWLQERGDTAGRTAALAALIGALLAFGTKRIRSARTASKAHNAVPA